MTNKMKKDIRFQKCSLTEGTTMHEVGGRRYVYTDRKFVDKELPQAYICKLTSRPCVARYVGSADEMGLHEIRLDIDAQKRCPLYNHNGLGFWLKVSLETLISNGNLDNEEVERRLKGLFAEP